MTEIFKKLGNDSAFEDLEYRLLYLRPSFYSDERIAIGLIASARGRVETRFVSSPAAIELMSQLFGEDGVEQFHFASGELRRSLSKATSLDLIEPPTDLLLIGEKIPAFTSDRNGLLAGVLEMASCLIRARSARSKEVIISDREAPFTKELFSWVSRLNPLIADRIFDQTFVAPTGEEIDLPILGDKIFGAPLSFLRSDQTMRAESYVAKFHWLSRHLIQKPRLYLLAPQGSSESKGKAENIRELSEIAKSLNVPLKISTSTEHIATLIVQDEAA